MDTISMMVAKGPSSSHHRHHIHHPHHNHGNSRLLRSRNHSLRYRSHGNKESDCLHHVQRPAATALYATDVNGGDSSNGGCYGNQIYHQHYHPHTDGNGNDIACHQRVPKAIVDNSTWLSDRSLTREVSGVINGRLGKTSTIESDSVQKVFNDMHLYPTESQVSEMLQCAKNCSRRKGTYLTIGELCFYVRELRRSKTCRRQQKLTATNKFPECTSKCEVFLGGSCNPTTWRTDTAIPELNKHGITYYNPQVSMWAPELVAKEHSAKQAASLLLFVVDSETRSVAGMIEVAYLVAGGRCVVLVANPYRSGQTIMGESLTNREYHDLVNGQTSLLALVKSHGIKVHSNLSTALNCTAHILRNSSELNMTAQQQVLMKLNKLREVFDEHDTSSTGELNLEGTLSAYHKLTGSMIKVNDLYHYLSVATTYNNSNINNNITIRHMNTRNNNRRSSNDIVFATVRVSFEQFCALVAEFHDDITGNAYADSSNGIMRNNDWASKQMRHANAEYQNGKMMSHQNGVSVLNGNGNINITKSGSFTPDIFLGGSCSSNATWRENVAIPLIAQHNLTYYNPANETQLEHLSAACDDNNLDLSELLVCEASVLSWKRALERSRVLVFVVGGNRRALTTMILAAYYIGMGRDVILCIEQLPTQEDMLRIDDELLSKQAIKDYNRGRVYLADIAKRKQVPVFDSVTLAIECAISHCQNTNTTTSSR